MAANLLPKDLQKLSIEKSQVTEKLKSSLATEKALYRDFSRQNDWLHFYWTNVTRDTEVLQ